METIYFPAGGFGFWYLLGKYEHIREKQSQYILSGSSAGSLICLSSLVDFSKHNFAKMMLKVAIETLVEYRQRTYFVNLYIMLDIFICKLFVYIDETCEKTKEQLARLRIQTTVFHPPFWFEKRQTTPTSLAHLRELCLASCYIPFVANYGNRLTYIINGERHIDGAFIDFYIPHTVSFCVVSYRGLRIPSIQNALAMRDIAYNEPFVINRTYDGRVWIVSPVLLCIIAIMIAMPRISNTIGYSKIWDN
jgi:hypothetical protein